MSTDTSRLFTHPDGNGLRFFLDPVQIQKDKKRELLLSIRGSGGIYVPSVEDADVVLSVCETDGAETYAKEHRRAAVVDFDWVNHCLSKRSLVTGTNWGGYLVVVEEEDKKVKEETDLQQNGSVFTVNKLPSPVSPGLALPQPSPSTSSAARRQMGTGISGQTAVASPPHIEPTPLTSPSPGPDALKTLIAALSNIMPSSVSPPPKAARNTQSPTASSRPSTSNPFTALNADVMSLMSKSAGGLAQSAKGTKISNPPPITPATSLPESSRSSLSSLHQLPSDTKKKLLPLSISTSAHLPAPISFPSPIIKTEQFSSPQRSPMEIPSKPLFTHPTEGRPIKLHLVSDLTYLHEYTRIAEKYGAQIGLLLTDCDYAIVDKGSVRKRLVARSGKPAVLPDWIAQCQRQKKLLPTEPYILHLNENATTDPVIKSSPMMQNQTIPERVPNTPQAGIAQALPPPKLSIPSPSSERVIWKPPTFTPVVPGQKPLGKEQLLSRISMRKDSPPPTVPAQLRKGKSGYAFTKQDEEFFDNYAAWRRRRDPGVSDQAIISEVAKLALHHPDNSWRNWHWRRSHKPKRVEKEVSLDEDTADDLVVYEANDTAMDEIMSDPGPPPSPPKSFLPRAGGAGCMYTDVDEAYVIAIGHWMLKKNPKVTIREIIEEVGKRAPHHYPTGWQRHVSLWKLYYTEKIYGPDSKEATALRDKENKKETAKKQDVNGATRVLSRKRPADSVVEPSKPRKSHKAIVQPSTSYSFPRPTHRRESVKFTHADLQLVVTHIERHPNMYRLDDKLWIRFAEEHPQFTWRDWQTQVIECSELIDHELEIRKQQLEDEEAEEEEEEVDMEIDESDVDESAAK